MTARILLQRKESLEISHNPQGPRVAECLLWCLFFCRKCEVLVGLASCPRWHYSLRQWGKMSAIPMGGEEGEEALDLCGRTETHKKKKKKKEKKASNDTGLGLPVGLFCLPDVEQKPGHLGGCWTGPWKDLTSDRPFCKCLRLLLPPCNEKPDSLPLLCVNVPKGALAGALW